MVDNQKVSPRPAEIGQIIRDDEGGCIRINVECHASISVAAPSVNIALSIASAVVAIMAMADLMNADRHSADTNPMMAKELLGLGLWIKGGLAVVVVEGVLLTAEVTAADLIELAGIAWRRHCDEVLAKHGAEIRGGRGLAIIGQRGPELSPGSAGLFSSAATPAPQG